MKKYLLSVFLITSLCLISTARSNEASITIDKVKTTFTYTPRDLFYDIAATVLVPAGNNTKSCKFNGIVSKWGNYNAAKFSETCGDYIVRMITTQVKQKNPREGVSIRLVVEVDYRGLKEYKVLGKKYIEVQFIDGQVLEEKPAEKPEKIY